MKSNREILIEALEKELEEETNEKLKQHYREWLKILKAGVG